MEAAMNRMRFAEPVLLIPNYEKEAQIHLSFFQTVDNPSCMMISEGGCVWGNRQGSPARSIKDEFQTFEESLKF